ncbi:hypothetical protein BFJ70_g16367 [Fusarium oxysporum]|nr:hypothetical protein BFJ70_g16367 [Fusarium oxysporum]
MSNSGIAHKLFSVLLRLWELSCAVIVLGILSRFCYLLTIAQASADSRIVYAMVTAGISIMFTIFFCPPFDGLFLSFAFDFVLFIMWLVAYSLLQTRTGTHVCSSSWYYNYWGYYWGRFWDVGPIGRVNIGRAGCAQYRTVLAFSFMASFAHLLSGILGIYVFRKYIRIKETAANVKRQATKLAGRKSQDHGNGYPRTEHQQNGAGQNLPAQIA